MPRKNGNAGQPNREAQRDRHAHRVQMKYAFRDYGKQEEYPPIKSVSVENNTKGKA